MNPTIQAATMENLIGVVVHTHVKPSLEPVKEQHKSAANVHSHASLPNSQHNQEESI